MTKPRVLLDCDGVLADFVSAMLDVVYVRTGKRFVLDDVKEYDITKALGLTNEEAATVFRDICTPGHGRKLHALPGAQAGVIALRAIAEVYIVTSPWNSNPTWTHDREWWLEQHFGIPHSHVIHTSAKHVCVGDVLVDDKTSTLRTWQEHHPRGLAVQWRTPHNRNDDWRELSLDSWDQLRFHVEGLR